MVGEVHGKRLLWAVWALLGLQILLFWLSLDAVMAIGIFCTAAGPSALSLFGYVHFAYAALLPLGITSLIWPRTHQLYIVAITMTLIALPVQIWLIERNYLYCDGP